MIFLSPGAGVPSRREEPPTGVEVTAAQIEVVYREHLPADAVHCWFHDRPEGSRIHESCLRTHFCGAECNMPMETSGVIKTINCKRLKQ